LCLWLCCTYCAGIAWFCIDIAFLAVLHLLHWYCAFGCVAPITLVLRGFALILRSWLCCTYCNDISPLAVLHLLQWYCAFGCVAPIALVLLGFALILRSWLCCTYYTGIAWFCIDIAVLAVLHLLQWYFALGCVAPITLVLLGFAMILRPWVCCSHYTDSAPLLSGWDTCLCLASTWQALL